MYTCYVNFEVYLKKVIWLGDSKIVLSDFPESIKIDFGFQLYLLQTGKSPLRSRPMQSIGKGVFELKEQDSHGWYRIVYTIEFKGKLYILHSFRKQSTKTSSKDLSLAQARLKLILKD